MCTSSALLYAVCTHSVTASRMFALTIALTLLRNSAPRMLKLFPIDWNVVPFRFIPIEKRGYHTPTQGVILTGRHLGWHGGSGL